MQTNEFEQLIQRIKNIGFTADYCDFLREQYRDDIEGLASLLMYFIAMFDDRHEYID